jgi:hypothetical protein
MEEFLYKEYTEEESRIYHESMQKIMEGLRSGLPFSEACSAAAVPDEKLRSFIEDDALKILIADMHYTKCVPLEQIAQELDIQLAMLTKANAEMLQDIEISSTEIYRSQNPGTPTGTA